VKDNSILFLTRLKIRPMHEYILADKVLQSALEFAKENGLQSIHEIDIDVGELLGMETSSLSVAFKILSEKTEAEGSKLRVHRVKGIVVCNKCGFRGGLKQISHTHSIDPAFACPNCAAPVSVETGNDIKINSIS
jgi:hydrogenase nickel insertion protein HypA